MAKELSALLSEDPFVQSTGVFVKNFFITGLIQPSQVPLQFFHAASASVVCTDLSIEVKKSSRSRSPAIASPAGSCFIASDVAIWTLSE
jgi:hypothetical protein